MKNYCQLLGGLDNKMALNTTKTKAVVIGTSRKLWDLLSDFSITINDSQIENTVNEKLLEVD